jgi:3',5'-cyclic AMP phosphodiesterase CpdA
VRLIHLTDPHLTEPPNWRRLIGRSHFGKRFLGYTSWSRNRRHKMRREWLDEVQAEVSSRSPDQILLTGDLTQIGTAEEIRDAGRWLERLGPPEKVSLVPVNHDTYARDSWPSLLEAWKGYLPAEGPEGFPFVRRLGEVALFGLTSAVPTRPVSACGLLGEDQMARLEAALEAHPDALRVLLLHHPPLPGMIQFRKRLRDAPGLERLLGTAPVDLMLYGHRHRNLAAERLGARLFCTAPASALSGAFRQFDIESDQHGWMIRHTLMARSGPGRFDTVETAEWRVSGRG